MQTRRSFVKSTALAAAGISAGQAVHAKGKNMDLSKAPAGQSNDLFFNISLAQWSLNKSLFGGKLDNLDFPEYTKTNFDIHAVEYVNQFFKSAEKSYVSDLLKRTQDLGIINVLIMVDEEGNLGEVDETKRKTSVENHYKWVEAAQLLGCHSIRVNAGGHGSEEEVAYSATLSLRELSQFAADYGINVLVENHGGYSSRASWLSAVIRNTGMVNCGTLPDFGNFRVSRSENYDIYLGIKELMPLAKGVSAKSSDFDEEGNETTKDFYRILKIVKDAGFRGYIGIEYEGDNLGENEGIIATKKLLLKAGQSL